VAPSYLGILSACAASAAEAAAKRKEDKYTENTCYYHFFPIAFETFDPINQVGTDFISDLGHHFSSITVDQFESNLTFSIAFCCDSMVCFTNSFTTW